MNRNKRAQHSKQERKRRIYARDKARCQIAIACEGVDLSYEDATLDHIIPYSHMGPTTDENLQLSCRPCNELKANIYECPCGLPPSAQGCRKGIERAWTRYADDLEWRAIYREWKAGLVDYHKPHWSLPLDELEEFFRARKAEGIRP